MFLKLLARSLVRFNFYDGSQTAHKPDQFNDKVA